MKYKIIAKEPSASTATGNHDGVIGQHPWTPAAPSTDESINRKSLPQN